MGFFSFLTKGGARAAGEVVDKVAGGIRNVRNTFAKNLPPDQQAEFDLKIRELESDIGKAQAEIGKAEAGSSRFFVAGARPFILWICGIALSYHFLIAPLISQIWGLTMPLIDMGPLMTLLFGMLGLAGLRTYEKAKNIQNNH